MTIEKIVKTTFRFQLDNIIGSLPRVRRGTFRLDEVDVKRVVLFDEALIVSDFNCPGKKYLVVKKEAFNESWLLPTLENISKDDDFLEKHLAEIIKDLAGFFCSDSSEDFINYCGEEANKKFLEAIIEKQFNFSSGDENIRSEAISRVKKYFGWNFIEEFTFVDDQDRQHQLLVFEDIQWR